MLQLTPQHRIFIAVEPADFRKGIDGFAQLCREKLNDDPFSGALFVFCNKRKIAIRVLAYDGQGFWLCTKRFSEDKLKWWPKSENTRISVTHRELQILLWNGDPMNTLFADDWRQVA